MLSHSGVLIVSAFFCVAPVDVYSISRSRSKLQDEYHQLHGVLPIAEMDNTWKGVSNSWLDCVYIICGVADKLRGDHNVKESDKEIIR